MKKIKKLNKLNRNLIRNVRCILMNNAHAAIYALGKIARSRKISVEDRNVVNYLVTRSRQELIIALRFTGLFDDSPKKNQKGATK